MIECLRFWKVQSIGNSFPLVLEGEATSNLDDLARSMADPRFGVGGDGLLVVGASDAPQTIRLRMFNPDGTEDFCGNGLRCAGVFAHKHLRFGPHLTIEHGGQRVDVGVNGSEVTTQTRAATYAPSLVPHNAPKELYRASLDEFGISDLSALSTGSTHVVIPTDELPTDAKVKRVGRLIEHHPLFQPARTSVIWSKSVANRELRIVIWERGVGITMGCGTGSSAAAVDHLRRHSLSGEVVVRNPGGDVSVCADSWDADIIATGPAEVVFRGVMPGHDGISNQSMLSRPSVAMLK